MELPLRAGLSRLTSRVIGGFGFHLGRHLHKTEAPRLTSNLVGDQVDTGDLAETRKQVLQFLFSDCIRQVPNT